MDTINVTSCLQRICLSTDNKLLLVINFAKQILSKTKLILALNNNYQKKKKLTFNIYRRNCKDG